MSADNRAAGRELRRPRFTWLAELALILVLAAVLVHLGLRRGADESGVVRVEDDEVAVVTDLWSGDQRAVLTPGFELILPRVEAVHKLDKSPEQYVMQGFEREGHTRVPKLVARARDGSVVWFERVVIQYGLDVRRLTEVLQDTGVGPERRAQLVDATAPAVLIDELGRFTPEAVASPESLQGATTRAQERLNALLSDHGIEVYEVALSKPSFDARYEETLERREVAEQEIGSLRQQASLMEKGQPALLAELEGKKRLELQKLQDTWELKLKALQDEAEVLRAGRPEELAQLEQYRELELQKARAEWAAELEELERSARELETASAQRLAEAERAQALELEEAAAQRARALTELALEGEQSAVQHEARLAALRRESELALETLRGELAERLEAARLAAAQAAFEAGSYRAARLVAGESERAQRIDQAAALEQRHRREHETFLARAEAFEAQGAAAVRAALVGRLSSILFEIAPWSPPPGAEGIAPRKAAARVAASEEGAR